MKTWETSAFSVDAKVKAKGHACASVAMETDVKDTEKRALVSSGLLRDRLSLPGSSWVSAQETRLPTFVSGMRA